MMQSKTVLIYSGGMDSTVLLAKLCAVKGNDNVFALTFDYGSKHNAKEIAAAIVLAKHFRVSHEIVSLGFMKTFPSALMLTGDAIPEGHYEDLSMKQTVVPFRNGILLALAAGYAESIEAREIFYGAHAGDHAIYPDCRPEFIKAMTSAVKFGTYAEITLCAPFQNMSKREIAVLGKTMDVTLKDTWTCYKGLEKHCGRCGACTERREALEGFDETEYL